MEPTTRRNYSRVWLYRRAARTATLCSTWKEAASIVHFVCYIQRHKCHLIPTGTPTESCSSKVLNLAYDSKPEFKFAFPLGTGPSAPIETGYKLCTTTGSLKVIRGEFTLKSMSDIDFIGSNITSPLDYVTSGSLDLEMNNFTAYVECRSRHLCRVV